MCRRRAVPEVPKALFLMYRVPPFLMCRKKLFGCPDSGRICLGLAMNTLHSARFGTLGTLWPAVFLGLPMIIASVVLADEAVEGRLVVLWVAAWCIGQPGIELRLQHVDIPAWEVVPDALDDGLGKDTLSAK